MKSNLKIAIVTDWLVAVGGAEKVLEQILICYPHADLFSIVDFLPKNQRSIIMNKVVTTSFIQKLPFAKTKYRGYLPLMPLAIEQFDLSKYDLIISSSHAVAKGVISGPNQLHICYCHSPIRYAWDLQHQYLRESNLTRGIKSWLARIILHKIRLWDLRTINSVDYFIANSTFIAKRIAKLYRRESTVIYPPVAVDCYESVASDAQINDDIQNNRINNKVQCSDEGFLTLTETLPKQDFYITVSRMVPYKKIDIIVEAFINSPKRNLIVIGDGPMYKHICQQIKNANVNNIKLLGYQSNSVISDYLQRAKGFVFAAEEDFGIVPVEAMAHGVPVIAYGRGGVLDSVIGSGANPTGVFFPTQEYTNIIAALDYFEEHRYKYTATNCKLNAKKFANERFRREFTDFINSKVKTNNK